MKVILFYCLLGVVSFVSADTEPHFRGCIYISGTCVRECEEGTHAYATGCSPVTPEPTCEQPNPQPNPYDTCDFTACYCDPPTVRDTAFKKCVLLKDCPRRT